VFAEVQIVTQDRFESAAMVPTTAVRATRVIAVRAEDDS